MSSRAADTADTKKKERRKKPDELLSSVVMETAVPAAVELLKDNTAFAFPSGTAWVMLLLPAESIGGLSKKSAKDEAKGQIVELISDDQIATVATKEMLAEETLGIIPNSQSLSTMEEFSLLTGADYMWAVVYETGTDILQVQPVADARFDQAEAVHSGDLSLRDAIGGEAWNEHSGVESDEEEAVESAAVADASQSADVENEGDEVLEANYGDGDDAPVYDEDEPQFVDVVDDEVPEGLDADTEWVEGDTSDVEPEPEVESEDEDDENEEQDGYEAPAPAAAPTESAPESPRVTGLADQEQVRDQIARRFMSEDLNLEVRLDEFDATFAIGAPVVQIQVPEGASEWLGDQVAQLSRQANADVAQLHFAHEDELRARYVSLMGSHIEDTLQAVSTDREGSRYKMLKDSIEADRKQKREDQDQVSEDRRREIEQDYEAQAQRVGEQARQHAELQFRERNRSRMEREQNDALAGIERSLEDDYTQSLQGVLKLRAQDASTHMQRGTTQIFEVIAEMQREFLDEEQTRLAEWNERIQEVVNENRQADIARADALAEKQRTTDEIGALRKEHETLVNSMRTEQQDRLRRAEEELERQRKDALQASQARDAEWQHRLDLEKTNSESHASKVTELLGQIDEQEDTLRRHFENQIAALRDQRDASNFELKNANESQAQHNKLMLLVALFAAIACGVAGIVVGAAFI